MVIIYRECFGYKNSGKLPVEYNLIDRIALIPSLCIRIHGISYIYLVTTSQFPFRINHTYVSC
jgi:hypothetical protein